MRVYKIKGEVCRFERRENKEVCRKATTKYIGMSGKGLVCLRNNFDRIFESLELQKPK